MKPTVILLAAVTIAAAGCASAPPAAGPRVVAYEQKLASILRLEDARILRDPAPPAPSPALRAGQRDASAEVPPPPVDDLEALLQDPEGRVRRRAALAIGRVGLAEGVEPLGRALEDPDAEVREMAAFALGLTGAPAATEALTAALADSDPRVQGRAAEALGSIGAGGASADIGRLAAAKVASGALVGVGIDDLSWPLGGDVEAFRLALYALVRLDAWEAFAAAALDARGEPTVRWWPVAYAVQRIGDPRGFPALALFARGEGVEAVAFAARGLGVLKDPRGVDLLLPLLDPARRDPRIVAAAVRALGQIGERRAAASILSLLKQPGIDDNVRLEAVTALGVLAAGEARDVLIDLTAARWAPLRGAAFTALAATDPEGLLFVLSSLDADPDWTVRAELATALSTVDPELALPRMMSMLRDPDPRVVPRALEGLAKLKAPGLDGVLLEHLRAPDAVVRSTAARLLGERRPAGCAGALAEAYLVARPEPTYVARAAALTSLAGCGLEAAGDSLRAALGDPDWAVRRRSADLLARLDPAADVSVIRPAPTTLARADYESPSLLRPEYSPQAYLETAKGTIRVELAVLDAPLTVQNFVSLVRAGHFDGLTVHRVVAGFVVQDGDPRGDGEGGPGYTIRDEVNVRPYLRGTVGMALDWADTGGSQYFITLGPQPHLDGRYTAFGLVVSGMEVVDRLTRGDRVERVRVWDGHEWIEGPSR
jgi:cyclophilin family peptidyl-prolyl cis-trans isomerase/HEAT repeat protein